MSDYQAAAAALKAEQWLVSAAGFELLNSIFSVSQPENATAPQYANSFNQSTNGKPAHNGVHVIPVVGPMATYDNFISKYFGWTTYQSLTKDLAEADANSQVSKICLYFDTVGGMTKGMSETASRVKNSNTPVVSYVGGVCASAGYWLASQTQNITVAPDAIIGSIGTICEFSGPQSNVLTSSNAPKKNMGRPEVQNLIDALEALFIQAVADGRGVNTDTVKRDFGKGDVFVGAQALSAGMVDRVAMIAEAMTESSSLSDTMSTKSSWGEAAAFNKALDSEIIRQ